jgi:hypothetical protein
MIILLIVVSGCHEISVTTKVNKNGSFTRFITVSGDSADVFKVGLPYPVDDSWTKTASTDSTDTTKYILVYTKTFKNSRILNREISADTSWQKDLNRKIEIKKGFGFFYSYITFRETYFSANTFNRLNFKDYLSQDDILYFTDKKIPVTSEDSLKYDKASENVMNFLEEVLVTEIVAILENGIKQVNDPTIDPSQVATFKDSIRTKLDNHYDHFEAYIDFYKNWTGNQAAEKLKLIQPPLFDEFNKKASRLIKALYMEGFSQNVEMPGLLTGTNSTNISGNQVSWEVENGMFLFQDYEMVVESRVVNTWAFWVTGIVILSLLIFLVIKAWK